MYNREYKYSIKSAYTIVELRKDSPADKAGLLIGDVILKIDDSDENIIISIIDVGVGISDENIKRIFEPFFTTKRGLGGSGLGLNIAYNTVVQNR